MHVQEKIEAKKEVKSDKFVKATDNWLNFQPEFEGTFKTTQRESYKPAVEQESPFKLRETQLTGDKDKLKEY